MAFELKMTGSKAAVTRSLDLPKAENVAAVALHDSFGVEIDLGAIKPGPDRTEILKQFENVYRWELNQAFGKLFKGLQGDWDTGVKALAKLTDEKSATVLGTKLQKTIMDGWNAFPAQRGIPLAKQTLESVLKKIKTDAVAKAGTPKLKLSHTALKDDRVGILTSFLKGLAIVAVGVPTGGWGWVAAGLGGLEALFKGVDSAMALSVKRSGDAGTNLDMIRSGLGDATKALDSLAPSVARMADSRRAFVAEMALAAADLAKAQKSLAEMESKAAKSPDPKVGAVLKKLRTEADALYFKARAFESSVDQINAIEKAIEAAAKATAAAAALTTREVTARKTEVSALQSLWKDKVTLAASYKEVAKVMAKLV